MISLLFSFALYELTNASVHFHKLTVRKTSGHFAFEKDVARCAFVRQRHVEAARS